MIKWEGHWFLTNTAVCPTHAEGGVKTVFALDAEDARTRIRRRVAEELFGSPEFDYWIEVENVQKVRMLSAV